MPSREPPLLLARAAATAQVGTVTAKWTSYSDRLKEDLVLTSRPSGDQIEFGLSTRSLTCTPDGIGGYLAQESGNRVLTITVTAWADPGYSGGLGDWLKKRYGIVLELVAKVAGPEGFVPLPR